METELFEKELYGPASGAGIAAGIVLNMLLEEVLAMKPQEERNAIRSAMEDRARKALLALPTEKGTEAAHVLDIAFAPKP